MVSTKPHTIQELWNLGSATERFELIEGELIEVTPARRRHGILQMEIGSRLLAFVKSSNLGIVTSEEGFIFSKNPNTVLAPDIAFVRKDRAITEPELWSDYPPDLVVEIVSPSDRQTDIDRKVRIYLDGGVRTVWIVNPAKKRVIVYEPGQKSVTLSENESLDGGEVLPGFTFPLASIFDL